MRILVTGGAGFIGSAIVERLLGAGADVRVLDNFSTGRRENLTPFARDIDVIEADLRCLESVRDAVRGCDAISHQAALPSVPRSIADPLTSHAANATGTLNVLLAARDAGIARTVLASSSSVYGAVRDLPKREDMATRPISPYAVSKLAAEQYARSFHEVFGLETVALRYFNVFGPRQDPASEYAAVIPRFVQALLDHRPPVIFGDGEQSRDFTYVDNVVDANVAALARPGIAGGIYNIACGEAVTLNRLAADLRALVGSDLDVVHGDARPGEVRHSLADVSRARADLGYVPRTGFSDGLRATVEYFMSSAASWRAAA